MTIPSGKKLGRYEIRSKLGAGGMGEVYLAQDTSELGRAVALKIVPAEVAKDKDRLQRFTQEARTVSNLNHPNILTVYEFGQTDSGSYIASEYIDGLTLREYLSGRRLKLIDILDLAIQTVAALNAAVLLGTLLIGAFVGVARLGYDEFAVVRNGPLDDSRGGAIGVLPDGADRLGHRVADRARQRAARRQHGPARWLARAGCGRRQQERDAGSGPVRDLGNRRRLRAGAAR